MKNVSIHVYVLLDLTLLAHVRSNIVAPYVIVGPIVIIYIIPKGSVRLRCTRKAKKQKCNNVRNKFYNLCCTSQHFRKVEKNKYFSYKMKRLLLKGDKYLTDHNNIYFQFCFVGICIVAEICIKISIIINYHRYIKIQ